MGGLTDTSDEARRRQREVLRRAGGVSRLRMALEMSAFVRELALSRIRAAQPELSRREAVRVLLELEGVDASDCTARSHGR